MSIKRVDGQEERHDHQDAAWTAAYRVERQSPQAASRRPARRRASRPRRQPHQRAELQADDGDDQHQRVAQDVPVTTRRSLMPLLRAVRTKSAFSTSSTPRAWCGQQRHRPDAQRHRRQDEVAEAAIAVTEARQPLEFQPNRYISIRPNQNCDSDRPEMRRPSRSCRPGCPAAAPPGIPGDADQDREGHGRGHELKRRPDPLTDQGRHRFARAERFAEIARHGVAMYLRTARAGDRRAPSPCACAPSRPDRWSCGHPRPCRR